MTATEKENDERVIGEPKKGEGDETVGENDEKRGKGEGGEDCRGYMGQAEGK